MKQFVPEWLCGMQLLLRLVIMLFCVVAGPALALAAHFGLIAIGFQVAPPALVIVQFFYIIKVGPLLLAGTPTIVATGLVPLSRNPTLISRLSCRARNRHKQILVGGSSEDSLYP